MIVYVGFEVQVHGQQLRTWAEVVALQSKIEAVLREHIPTQLDLSGDIEVNIEEWAGEEDE